ncbi:multi-sensor signal transduction histidine kinase [Gracilibacillus halophilus YIM-C55.5]|uniref:histidine kinase n=1 Tax=Gracilibacillus halophilus YIM-C55.5 TaxID=1308866 RepID=N4WPH9_9BACI|nr:sensor histidine kinase [Gracilibacillus halophilus]ENH98017.1 multi-sensor signal transduction histidine kinase [Gracilibacillus halophilus YIM-C55.5]
MKRWTQINNLPIRYKLISHFLMISILPIICLGFLFHWTTERVLEQQANDHTMQLISKVNETFSFYMNNLQSITYLVAGDEKVDQFFAAETKEDQTFEIQRYLRHFTTLSPEVAGIMVVNHKGEYISNELYAPSVMDLTEASWYEKAIESRGIFQIIGRPEGRRLTSIVNYQNDEVVSVVRAVTDPFTNEVKGVILIDLKLRVIAEAVQDVRLGKTGYLMVIDEKGQNIYQPSDPIVEHIPMEWVNEQPSGEFSKTMNGKRIQYIYQQSSFANWTTIGVFPQEETLLEMSEIRFYLIIFIFIIMLFGFSASYFLSHSISKPITQLMNLMQRAEAGDFKVRYQERRDDEVGLLGRSFNKMIQQLNGLMRLTKKQERQKRDAEFRSLQANINPHFLYNTLDTIQWMARKRDATDVAEIVGSLAKLFRIGLSKGKDMITVEQEIEHISSYLRIQQTRYRHKLDYQMNVEEEVQSSKMLKFILQPIVENSIYHGIKERRGLGMIEIQAERKQGMLHFIIRDDGVGMNQDQLKEMQLALKEAVNRTENPENTRDKKGYGLLNVQARIELTFGDSYGMNVNSEEGKGTTVELWLPLLPNDTDKGDESDGVERLDR